MFKHIVFIRVLMRHRDALSPLKLKLEHWILKATGTIWWIVIQSIILLWRIIRVLCPIMHYRRRGLHDLLLNWCHLILMHDDGVHYHLAMLLHIMLLCIRFDHIDLSNSPQSTHLVASYVTPIVCYLILHIRVKG